MRLTLRGWTAVAVVAAAMALAWQYGPRALNAIVAPLVVVLAAGLVTTVRIDRPTVRRTPVAAGFVGERRRVEVEIETGSAVAATVRDAVADGCTVLEPDTGGTSGAETGGRVATETAGTVEIDGDGRPVLITTLEGDDRFVYDVRLEGRGEHRLGPLTITVSDVLGLVERRFAYDETRTVIGYPIVRDLRAGPDDELEAFLEAIEGRDREAFDHLREYQRGDSLRDVHWKSAAKRPDADLVVTEYTADEETGSVTVAAESATARDDELATAAASVATYLLEAGVDVGVSLPEREFGAGAGREHHRDVLAALATYDGGDLDDRRRERADVLVRADSEGTRVIVDGRAVPFDRLAAGRNDGRQSGDAGSTDQRRPDGGKPGVMA
ncbi:DUF58 domain-containing protein [Haloterrigena alkaliphila]|uniref:DUF58 domain-containing protein n=1 Tax=Haloterrigena alkaliphila TaxID=2816475 RepID=A0A8A2VFZ3_9EURY|nr:DUF58 domain-containing protein [Haloterrigena alkaliphila]QSX00442.1 DUF58 domain-containing protein [Haloterrigena alkaliphila]